MPPPEPPRRGVPIGRITEVNAAHGPHTPVPPGPPASDTATTLRPPADPRPPPRGFAGPRQLVRQPPVAPPPLPAPLGRADAENEQTLVGLGPHSEGSPAPTVAPSLVPPAEVERYERKLAQKAWRQARRQPMSGEAKAQLLKLVAAVTGFIAAGTITLQLVNAWLEPRIKNVEAKVHAQEVVTKPLPAAAASADKSADACRDWARAYAEYDRQIFAKLGVVIPLPEGAQPSKPIDTQARVRKANEVTGAPILEVKTAPPPLP